MSQELKNDVQTLKNIVQFLMESNPSAGVWHEWHTMTEIKANGGDKSKMTETKKIADMTSAGDSVSLGKIDGQQFTIVAVQQSDYEDQSGVKITTLDKHQVGESMDSFNKFHTTRKAVVEKLLSEQVQTALAGDIVFTVKCVKTHTKDGKHEYFVLEDCS